MPLIILALIGSAIFLAILCAMSQSQSGKGWAFWFCLATVGIGSYIFCAVLSLQALLTAPVAAACYFRNSKLRMTLLGAGTPMLISYGIVFTVGAIRIANSRDLKAKYPLVSLAGQLAYEQPASARQSNSVELSAPRLASTVEAFLVEIEKRDGSNIRRAMLEDLHNGTYEEFVMAQGFGPVRVLGMRLERIELPTPLLPAPGVIPYESPQPGQDAPLAIEVPSGEILTRMHGQGLEDFLDKERIGYVRDREHVAGFESHAFSRVPDATAGTGPPFTTWKIARLELISMLRHKTPVAYVSKDLPNMTQLKEAATRPLDKFETDALDKLRTAEDLVIDEQPHYIRMVGSVRAGKDCLVCHNVQRGELLGAFSYELTPAVTEPKTDSVDK